MTVSKSPSVYSAAFFDLFLQFGRPTSADAPRMLMNV